MEKKTPLYEVHEKLGGKIVPFAGYLLPVEYSGVIKEHMAVRQNAGIFDVSHMGEFLVKGKDALKNLNYICSNDFTSMKEGSVRYTVICNENGGIVDDMLVYKMNDKYMLVPNAANREKDFKFIQSHLQGEVELEDISDSIAQIALQGPKSKEIILKLAKEETLPEKYYTFKENVEVGGINVLISRTGYTGEFGYELYCENKDAVTLWEKITNAGEENLLACGLGARDTLRLEAGMPLYGHEMTDEITPLETGLGFATKMKKENFIGKSIIEKKELKITRVGIKLTSRGIAREHNEIYIDGEKIGETTSGTHLPYLAGAYAMALVNIENSSVGTKLEIDVRGRKLSGEIVELPFYKN